MCDFRGAPSEIYLTKEKRLVQLTGQVYYDPNKETLEGRPAGMYSTYNVTGCGHNYWDGIRILKEFDLVYSKATDQWVPIQAEYVSIYPWKGPDGHPLKRTTED